MVFKNLDLFQQVLDSATTTITSLLTDEELGDEPEKESFLYSDTIVLVLSMVFMIVLGKTLLDNFDNCLMDDLSCRAGTATNNPANGILPTQV